MPNENLTIGAVGVGAVGTIIASCLADAGAEIVVSDIPVRNSQIDNNGLRVTWGEKKFDHRVKTVGSITELRDYNPDLIYVSTKACMLKRLMPEIAKTAGDNTMVLSVQNGIGTEDEVAKFMKPENVARMVVNYAGAIDENGDVKVNWFNPPNFFGPLVDGDHPALKKVVEMLNSVGMESVLVDSTAIKKKAYFKTVLNAALMPLCAVMNLTMQEAMQCKPTRDLACDVLKEGLAVGKELGFDYGEGILKMCEGYLDKGGNHHPSMSVDIQNKRPTEIDFINGKILEIGQEFDSICLETNRVLVSMLVGMELRNGTRKPDDIPEYLRKS